MDVLLDTHAFLWFITGDNRLSSVARTLIESVSNQPYLSIASLWEMAIKASLGKLVLAQPFEALIPYEMEQSGIEPLSIEMSHLFQIVTLEFHHRDPFDRLLIAQSQIEQLPIVSADTSFDLYPVRRIW